MSLRLRPQPAFLETGRVQLLVPEGTYAAEAGAYRDELFAWMIFNYLRSRAGADHTSLLLYYDRRGDAPGYRIVRILGEDQNEAVARAAELAAAGQIPEFNWRLLPARTLQDFRFQTRLFESAYNLPVRRRLEKLPRKRLEALLERFVRYKSTTDPRVQRQIEPVPAVLTPQQSRQMAADILTVAEFYQLPLEYFLGIGAMENNYMNVRGDLKHTIWKRRPARDDIVLERRRGRVRVLNDAAGPWQITRETLRYAHSLYKKDKRDYSVLPQRLRPPDRLDVNEVDTDALTTYAGLLLRDLLDRFNGDVGLAVGAYNGGPGNPNARYESGVRAAADHARRALEQAAALNGETVMETQWLTWK